MLLLGLLAAIAGSLMAALVRQFVPSLVEILRSVYYGEEDPNQKALDDLLRQTQGGGPVQGLPTPYETPEISPTPTPVNRWNYHETPQQIAIFDGGPGVPKNPGVVAATQTLATTSQGRALHVRITSSPRCMVGDMDIISEELRGSEKHRLLFSVEPLLKSSSFPPQVRQLTEGQFERGTTQSFALPVSDKPIHIGIFVCKDDEEEGRCRKKPIQSLDDLYLKAQMKQPGSSEPVVPSSDKTYFFEYAILERDTLHLVETELSVDNYFRLIEFLKPLVNIQEEALALVREVRRYNKAIKSVAAGVSSSYVVIDLPHLEPGVCQSRGPQPLFPVPPQPGKKPVDSNAPYATPPPWGIDEGPRVIQPPPGQGDTSQKSPPQRPEETATIGEKDADERIFDDLGKTEDERLKALLEETTR